jgi:hypothetical protein
VAGSAGNGCAFLKRYQLDLPPARTMHRSTRMWRFISMVAAAFTLAACGPPELPRPLAADQPSEPAHSAASLEGEVLGVDHTPPADSLESGTRVELRQTGDRPVIVDLAPGWYLDEQGIRYSRADRVQVEGTYIERQGRHVLYASRVKQGGRTVELRDIKGRPLWPAQSR